MTRRVNSRIHSFLESIAIPITPSMAIGVVLLVLWVALWRLKQYSSSPLDITTIYEIDMILIYGVLIGSYGLFMFFSLKRRTSFEKHAPRTRFLCLVPSFNEERVIENSIKSLLQQDYPRSMYEVVLVFDGTDKTGDIAGRLGARVIETPEKGSGKRAALAYAIDRLVDEDDERYVCVFDADNVAARDFLKSMNDAIVSKGYKCLQAYHDVLNKGDNWITKGLWAATHASSRLYNAGRYELLGVALICGTGWCCKGSLLKKYWSRVKTQTEDIELTGLLRLHEGEGVAWVPSTRFYDEKPRSLWVAIQQRRRWMIGHMRVFRYLGWRCLKEGLRRRDPALIELFVYYAVPFLLSLSIVQFFVIGAGICSGVFRVSGFPAANVASSSMNLVAVGYLFVYPVLGLGLGAGEWRKGPLYTVYAFFVSMIVWTVALVWAWFSMFRRDWVFHTPHVTCTSLQQILGPSARQKAKAGFSGSAANLLRIILIVFLLLPISLAPSIFAENKLLREFVPDKARFSAWLDSLECKEGDVYGLYPYFKTYPGREGEEKEFLSPMTSAKCILFWIQEGELQKALRTGKRLLYWQERDMEDAHPRVKGALPSEISWDGVSWAKGNLYYSGDNLVILEAFLSLYERTGREEFFLGAQRIAKWIKDVMCNGKGMGVWLEDYFAPMRFVTDEGNFDNRIFMNTEFLWISALKHFGEVSGDESFVMQCKLATLFYLYGQSENGAWYDHYDPGYPPELYSEEKWKWFGEDGTVIADNEVRAALGAYRAGAYDNARRFLEWLRPERGAVPAYLDARTGAGRFDPTTEPYYDVVVSGLLRVLASGLGAGKTVMTTDQFLVGTQNKDGGWYWGVRQVDRSPVENKEAVITGLWAVSNLIQ